MVLKGVTEHLEEEYLQEDGPEHTAFMPTDSQVSATFPSVSVVPLDTDTLKYLNCESA